MIFDNWQTLIIPTIIFSVFILIGNPIIVLTLMNMLGYTRKTSFLAGLTVAQISEFSLILIKLGFDIGHLSREIMSMVTLVGIVTIAGSTYMILYSDQLFKFVGKALSLFEFRKTVKLRARRDKDYKAIIFGYRRAGPEFAHAFRENKTKFLVVDFNPDTIQQLTRLKIPGEYGDASDIEFLNELPLRESKVIVSTVPDFEINLLLTQTVRRLNEDAVIIIIADTMEHAIELYAAGVTNVILSHYIGAHQAADMIMKFGLDAKKYEKIKEEQIKYLTGLKELSLRRFY